MRAARKEKEMAATQRNSRSRNAGHVEKAMIGLKETSVRAAATQAGAPAPMNMVPHTVDRTFNSISQVGQLVLSLEERLAPVLRLADDGGHGESPIPLSEVPLVAQLEAANNILDGIWQRLNSLISRLEV